MTTKFPAPGKSKRGLMNEYDCGCQVWRDGAAGGYFIHACAMHNAAEELLEVLSLLVNSPNAKDNDLWDRARAILAKARS